MAFLFESSLLFVNASYFSRNARQALDDTPGVRWFVLDATSIPYVDFMAMEALMEFKGLLDARGVRLILAGAHGLFEQALERSGFADSLGPTNIFPDAYAAVRHASPDLGGRVPAQRIGDRRWEVGRPGEDRTHDHSIKSRMLYR